MAVDQTDGGKTAENLPEKGKPKSIGLALSGGGFRATLFHLGVVDALREKINSDGRTALSRVTEICGVSGGSVIAAYLALKWDKIVGNDAASNNEYQIFRSKIIELTQRDVRNRVLRRIFLRHMLVFPWLLLPSWRSAKLLEKEYSDSLFENVTFEKLPQSSPFLSLLSTSLTTGQIVAFESDGVRFGPVHRHQIPFAPETDIPLARAVAASAGFPPLSSPVKLPSEEIGLDNEDGPDHELTDGGVYDNLGACWLGFASSKRAGGELLDLLLLSDAGIPFDWASRNGGFHKRTAYLKRNMRANDIQMTRLAEHDWKDVKHQVRDFREFRIGGRYASGPGIPSRRQQRWASRIRTDLDYFNDNDVDLLLSHGKNVTLENIAKRGPI